ncbi:MAG: alpha/beta fold hydrolase [Polaribacter sp.]|nr:alpha/beta fold hydrolase [Polaribacter sp.]
MNAQDWKDSGKFVSVDNNKLFVIDTDPIATEKETIVIISGYPLNSYDYHQIIDMLKDYYRVIIHDHAGFGFSDEPKDYNYSILNHANDCIKLYSQLKLKEFTIIASQYGAMIAKELLHKKNYNLIPFQIKDVVITKNNSDQLYSSINAIYYLNSNKHLPKYKEVLANYEDKSLFNTHDDSAFDVKYKDEDKVRVIWENFQTKEKQKEILILSSYNEEIFLYWHRWINAMKESKVRIHYFWRKDDFTNIQDALLLSSTYKKENFVMVENKNCYTIENEPKSWLLMILDEINKTTYNILKRETFVS